MLQWTAAWPLALGKIKAMYCQLHQSLKEDTAARIVIYSRAGNTINTAAAPSLLSLQFAYKDTYPALQPWIQQTATNIPILALAASAGSIQIAQLLGRSYASCFAA
jgi:hypothetical protein